MEFLQSLNGQLGNEEVQSAIDFGLRLLGAIVILAAGWWFSGLVRRRLFTMLSRVPHLDVTLVPLLASLARYGLLIVTLIAILSVFGVPVASFLVLLSGAALAIGLALQGTLSNVASGFLLLVLRPFNVGEYVEVAGRGGTVLEIGLFVTTLETLEFYRITVPNSAVLNGTMVNYSNSPLLRTTWNMEVAYETDLPRAMQIVRDLMAADERILSVPAPQVFVDSFGESAIRLEVRAAAKTDVFWQMERDLRLNLKARFEAEGIEIPFPQRVVKLVPDAGAKSAGD